MLSSETTSPINVWFERMDWNDLHCVFRCSMNRHPGVGPPGDHQLSVEAAEPTAQMMTRMLFLDLSEGYHQFSGTLSTQRR